MPRLVYDRDTHFRQVERSHEQSGAYRLNHLKTLAYDQTGTLVHRAISLVEEAERIIADQKARIAHLEQLCLTDELTSVFNRRGFFQEFRRSLAGAKRYGETGVVALCDLDAFKAINDSHGHAAGDEILKHTARTIMDQVRDIDLVARIGGDEFAVALNRCPIADGQRRLEDLSYAVNSLSVPWANILIPVRATFGYAAFGAEDLAEEVMRRADERLYRRKNRHSRHHLRGF